MMLKNDNLFLIGAAAVGVFLIYGIFNKRVQAQTRSTSNAGGAPWRNDQGYAQKIDIAVDNGWQYFTDGTAIDPNGRYYHNNILVYDPANIFGGAGL